jgi:site-specific DNA-methyltransferase (adenine-specific)
MIAVVDYTKIIAEYLNEKTFEPVFICGNALDILRELSENSIDCCMTSPPYWNKRQYHNGGVGLEEDYRDYIDKLAEIFHEIYRILKPSGSFWLNIGDTYLNKRLLGIPWRLSFKLMDEQRWILRNSIIWNKVKGGMDNTVDRLGNVHENIFHFVKNAVKYYYNADEIRSQPRKTKIVNGSIVSATGVRGVRYRRQIELSTALKEEERQTAGRKLDEMLQKISVGEISDFRMIIRGNQRTTHSNSESVSGRARELREKGFYFLVCHPNGSKPTDVWDILPEDTQRRGEHFAPYPEDLCRIPILSTCPPNGVVLDPFCGTGTTMLSARHLDRKSIGIDICERYLKIANERCYFLI